MNRKRRTFQCQHSYIPSNSARFSFQNFTRFEPLDRSKETMIKSIIAQFIQQAQQQIQLKQIAMHKFSFFLSNFNTQIQKYYQLDLTGSSPHDIIECQPQPTPSHSIRVKENFNAQQIFSKRKLSFNNKCKSQSCDLGDQMKRKDKYMKQLEESKKCRRNDFIQIQKNIRFSENEDRSEEIQQLLRRKKELFLESQQGKRLNTETSKALSIEKKEKKRYAQNDQGQGFEMLLRNTVKLQKEAAPIIRLSNIKVLASQQLSYQSNLKKRPIIELSSASKGRKRRNIEDTCVLLEHMHEVDQEDRLDQQQLIQQACNNKKGVKIVNIQRKVSILKLPSIR